MFSKLILFFAFFSFIQQIICFNFFKKHDYKVVGGSCSSNEKFSDCGSDCGHTCDDIFAKGANCSRNCTKGCFCEFGFYRDFGQKGQCVRSFECRNIFTKLSTKLKPICPKNQEYKCGSDCGQNCDDIGKDVKCLNTCDSGCYCVNGYYRDSRINGQCIKERHCKKIKEKKFNSKKREFVDWFKKHFPWKQ